MIWISRAQHCQLHAILSELFANSPVTQATAIMTGKGTNKQDIIDGDETLLSAIDDAAEARRKSMIGRRFNLGSVGTGAPICTAGNRGNRTGNRRGQLKNHSPGPKSEVSRPRPILASLSTVFALILLAVAGKARGVQPTTSRRGEEEKGCSQRKGRANGHESGKTCFVREQIQDGSPRD